MSAAFNTEWRGLLGEVARVARAVQRHGVAGSLRVAVTQMGRLAYVREAHVWYVLDPRSDLQPIGLPPGIGVLCARAADLHLLEQLPTISVRAARRRMAQGAELWIGHQTGRAAFACWIFHRKTPAIAARRGWVDLPPRTVGLDDSAVAPAFRGRAIAPACWAAVAGALGALGVEAIVTKIEETDLPCRRAIEKVGFRAVASMQMSRIGGHARVALHLHDQSTAGFLSAQLAR
jgi:hypothetical protein